MFVGHYAVGLAAKKFAPRASLGVLIAAPILLDLLWPIFLLFKWEQVAVVANPNPFLRFDFVSYPISHGLVAAIGWATLFASIYYGLARYLAGTITIWIGVVSHWLLDYVVHRPDLPLYAGSSRLFGLGLWNHRWWTIAVETAMFVLGVSIYLFQTKAKDKIGTLAFWPFVVLLLAAYGMVAFGPPPSANVKGIALGTLATVLLVLYAWWFDRHREPRAAIQDSATPATKSAAG
ncbi:MAG TPA: hypothetical protein VGQ72_04145 [Pyrinomonadaceae bacterium]|jgi:hypothetical protein|nr:hypothetical protein [Pyrinomonadaceae bacterium]